MNASLARARPERPATPGGSGGRGGGARRRSGDVTVELHPDTLELDHRRRRDPGRLGDAMRVVRRHGPLETARLGLGAAHRAIAPALSLHETHVWYELTLADAPAPPPRDDLEVRRANPGELHLLNRIPATGVHRAVALLARGGSLWLAFRDGRPAFSCWTWREHAPVGAARRGWLELPDGVACLEDSVTAAAFRGQGVAPAAWAAVVDALRREGARTLITKVGEDNAPSRRAVQKAGFAEVATMRTDRTWPRCRVEVSGAAGATAEALAAGLRRRW